MHSEDMTITKQANGLLYVHSQKKNNGRLPHQEPAVVSITQAGLVLLSLNHDLLAIYDIYTPLWTFQSSTIDVIYRIVLVTI